ncbi:LamB/YcsF family protein [Virgibacillus ndiopensis]|uniref:LamB/YcsF family protein n=1 Tax=Virgibacillus ndiopensis TaxID=2004408 RepID=UPI000C083F14|nr:5-oxoprolinase subunit PxpA [Virgibacillus ndiopensis]
MVKRIDLNCDMGESFGRYTIGLDEELLQYVTSANIACGFHAGDPDVMERTVRLAKKYNVRIGAHPGFADIAGFGRRMIQYTPEEVYRFIVYQIGALQAFCKIHNVAMQHVKPHGALYNFAAGNREVALAIAQAVYDVNDELILYGLAGSELIAAGHEVGMKTASEVFADRTYQADGTLTPRKNENALIKSTSSAVNQVLWMVQNGEVQAVDGTIVKIDADTICVHGDGEHAVEFVRELRLALERAGIAVGYV